jgi:RNA polymerase sigma factor (sigma-70 family)
MSVFEEHRLAGGAIAGDEGAVQALWQSHRRWVAAILLAHKPRHAELDDLLQDVAMSLVKNIHTLTDPLAVKPWLRTIAINAARSSGRRTQVVKKVMPIIAADAQRTAELNENADAPGDDSGRRALDLAQTLPAEYREPLMLRAVRGMSYRQIADVMGVPMTTIETRLARARRMLKERLEALDAPRDTASRKSQETP